MGWGEPLSIGHVQNPRIPTECVSCGALCRDVAKHREWHRRVEGLEARAREHDVLHRHTKYTDTNKGTRP